MPNPSIPAFLRSPTFSAAILRQMLPIRTNFEKFAEARSNPDKLTGPLSGPPKAHQEDVSQKWLISGFLSIPIFEKIVRIGSGLGPLSENLSGKWIRPSTGQNLVRIVGNGLRGA